MGTHGRFGVRSGARTEALLIITGSTGAGKTSVLAEASDILAVQIVPAAVDLDALGLAHLPSETANDEGMYGSLQSACRTALRGAVSDSGWRAMEERAELEHRQGVVAVENPVVCRLTASVEALLLTVRA
jgi:Ni2+-binding GTPase involved in maturation of urease and hydrogenase